MWDHLLLVSGGQAYARTHRVVRTVMPSDPTIRPPSRVATVAAGAGLAFGVAYATLLATFPLLGGAEPRARLQAAAVVALGFPTQFAYPFVVPFAVRVGIAPFAVRVGLACLNGVLWAIIVFALWRTARRQSPDSR